MTRLLLVDDDPNILDTARDILEDAGYEVAAAGTSAEALALLQKDPFHLALVDYNLPDAKGVQFAQEARRLRPELRVILMTGEARVDAGPPGVIAEVLTKPVDPGRLIALLQKTLPPNCLNDAVNSG